MKKKMILLSITLVLAVASDSFAFMETRLQWWEARLKKVTAEKARLGKDPVADRQILALMESETRRARAVIAVFESDRRNDGSLTHESRALTGADIAAEADRIVPPLCALRQLELMVSDTGDSQAARAAVKRRLEALVTAAFDRGSADVNCVVDRIMKEDIRPDEWKSIAVELRLGRVMEDSPRFRGECRAATVRAVAEALAARGGAANGKELRRLVVQKARLITDGYGLLTRGTETSVLEETHAWRSVRSAVEKDLSLYKKIIPLLPGGDMPLDRARTLLKNPDELEGALFRSERSVCAVLDGPAAGVPAEKAGDRYLDIPSGTGFLPAFDELEKSRRSLTRTLTGREDARFFEDLQKKLETIVARHTSRASQTFARGGHNLANGESGGGAQPYANEREFSEAKRSFEKGTALLAAIVKKSVDFAALVSSSRRMESGEILSRYRHLARRDLDYLRFLTGLVSDCSRLPDADDPVSAKRFVAAYGRTGGIFTFAGTALSLDARCRPFLTRQDRAQLAELMKESGSAIQSLKGDMRACRDRFSRAAAEDAGNEKQGRERLDGKIAQEDIDAHVRYAEECVVLFERYRYAEGAFDRYGALFEAFTRQARDSAVSPALAAAVKNASLFAALPDFDADRIRSEHESRRLLKAEAAAALSRLTTLVQFYRKHGVTVQDVPTPEEISSLRQRLVAPATMRVDAWIMTETNFREIDRKAALKLSLLLGRGSTARVTDGAGEQAPPGERTVVRLREPLLSLSLPRGWEEEQVGDTELYQGIVKSFHAGDGVSSLQVVKIPLENGDAKDAAEEWIRKGGRSLVEKQWRKANNLDCLLILASDRKKNISQTCALSLDGFAVLITGTTARNRYPSFREQFMKIIGSVQAGGM